MGSTTRLFLDYWLVRPFPNHAVLSNNNINLSPPSTAYMLQGIGSALVRRIACRLFGAKPLSNQCWAIVNWILRNTLQWIFFIKIKRKIIHENASENIVFEMAAILSSGRWVNPHPLVFTVLALINIQSVATEKKFLIASTHNLVLLHIH